MTTYSVTTAADSGAGSLRAAIQSANTDGTIGADSIAFAIGGGGPQTIKLASALPAITRTVAIDGESQAGYVGVPLITIDGSGAGAGADGLNFTGGGSSVVQGLSLVNFAPNASGAGGRAIRLADGGKDVVRASYLGLATDGVTAGPNGYGIEVDSAANTIGGLTGAARNIISGNSVDGIFLIGSGATSNIVEGNFIGTDVSGAFTVGNVHGVDIAAPNNVIGGTVSGAANVIAGNIGPGGSSGIGILFQGASPGNTVQGNRIGTGPLGNETQLGNVYGIFFGSPANVTGETITGETIGGTTAGAGNVISGNLVGITGNVTSSLIAGNLIGTDATGTTAIPNAEGIFLGAFTTTIGGTTAGARNIISGTSGAQAGTLAEPGAGITLSGASDLVEGNYIGTNAAGTAILPNLIGATFHLVGSTIGGTTLGAANVIAGNAGDGLRLDQNGGNAVEGNFIGTNVAGLALANGANGIFVNLPASTTTPPAVIALNDTIGGTVAGSGNVIANNGGAGVAVAPRAEPITGLSIRENSIYGNGKLGIDRGGVGVATPGYLFFVAATTSGGSITINGVFDGTPGQVYQVDLFANAQADPSGFGQGRTYLGTVAVTPGNSGLVGFQARYNTPPTGQSVITGTVTGTDGNTQDFSQAFPPLSGSPSVDLALTGTVSNASVAVGSTITYTETITNNGPSSTASGVVFNVALPTGLVNARISSPSPNAGPGSVSNTNIASIALGSLAPGASATVIITATASQLGSIQINPGVSSVVFDTNYANNQITQSLSVSTGIANTADLAITETASPANPAAGTATTYTVFVTNNGPVTSTNARVNDFLPAGATLVSVTPSQGAAAVVNGTLITDNLGTILPGTTAHITIVVTPNAPGKFTNSANVSGDQTDPIPANNSTSASVTVPARVGFSLSQTFSPTIGAIGQYQTFTVTATNTGQDPATNVTLIDALPANSTFVFATPSQGGPASLANGVITDNLGTIAAGKSATLTLVVLPTAFSTLINYAGVYSPDLPTVNPAFAYGAVAVPSGPSVIGVVGTKGNRQLIATFDEPLIPATAQNTSNYRLYALGTSPRAITARDKPLAITSAVYIPQTNAVVITPAQGLVATQYYALTIVGSTPTGIADTRGRRLIITQGGTPGADFNATFLAGTLPQG